MKMSLNNANVFVCSTMNFNKKMSFYGKANPLELNLLKLIYKYACYAPSEACRIKLDSIVSSLQVSSDLICINKIETGDFFPSRGEIFSTGDPSTNQPPTIDDITINPTNQIQSPMYAVDETGPIQIFVEIYRFSNGDFQNNFSDPEGDGPGPIILTSLPADGKLEYNGTDAVINQEIEDPTLLVYLKNTNSVINTSFTFRRFDDNENNPALSDPVTITISVLASSNQPPTIGDNTIYPDNRATTILTTAMFTSQLSPAYSDPEGDSIDAIRIDEISTSNRGVFQLNGVDVVVGQIITKANLDAGQFRHIGANVDDISSDTFSWSARDAGSQIWVS